MAFQNWLAAQRTYQETAFCVEFDEMQRDGTRLNEYVRDMLNAAFLELAEAQQETPWKPWVRLTPGQRLAAYQERHDAIVGELVDTLFFIANALLAVGCTDTELEARYLAKMSVNRRRQDAGYDGASTKCPTCKRALDEPGAVAFTCDHGVTYCSALCAETNDEHAAAIAETTG